MVTVSGIGSWPGVDVAETARAVRDLLTDLPGGVAGLPYLPELPDRGPGADLIGRTAGMLVGLDVELLAQGWRLASAPGRDARRATAYLQQDLDVLAEVFDGYPGRLKVQVAGPWTMAAALWLPVGDRALTDAGAVRDLTQSLVEGLTEHLTTVRRLLPGTQLVVQVDEPSLPAVLGGSIRSDSGVRFLRAIDRTVVADTLHAVVDAGRAVAGTSSTPGAVAVHCCASRPPVAPLRAVRPDAIAVDTTVLEDAAWESLAEAIDAGTRLWAGLTEAGEAGEEQVLAPWRRLGLPAGALDELTLTPACGLSGGTTEQARDRHRVLVEVAQRVLETSRA